MIAVEDLVAYSSALAVMWDVRRKIRNQIADNKEVTTSGIDAASLVVLNALRDKTSISRTEILRISNIESHYLCKILRKLVDVGYIQLVKAKGNGTNAHYAITELGKQCLVSLVK